MMVTKFNYEELCKKMVEDQLCARGIKDKRVICAFRKLPREMFVPEVVSSKAYNDFPLPIGFGQTISQPYIAALMTQELRLVGNEKVLEIGTGSGYQSAILAELASEVFTIEYIAELSLMAQRVLSKLGYKNIKFKIGDGTLGWKEEAPFDAIIVTAAAPRVPNSLLDNLSTNGRIVIPLGEDIQKLKVIRKVGEKVVQEPLCDCVFVKLCGKEG